MKRLAGRDGTRGTVARVESLARRRARKAKRPGVREDARRAGMAGKVLAA